MAPTYVRVWKETDPDFPRPVETSEEAAKWKPRGRLNRGQPRPPLASILVDLDAEQTAWVSAAAKAAGLSYVDFMRRLVDEAIARQPAGSQASANQARQHGQIEEAQPAGRPAGASARRREK